MTTNRRALIQIAAEQLEQLLDLPDGYEVLYLGSDFMRQAVVIGVGADDLTPVPAGCEPPILGGMFSLRQAVVDGELFFRWVWTPETPA